MLPRDEGPGAGHAGGALAVLAILLPALVPALMAAPALAQPFNQPPTAVITSPADGSVFLVGTLILFDGSSSIDDDYINLTYRWNLSGHVEMGRDKDIIDHTFVSPGEKRVVLTVVDSGGKENSRLITITVKAANRPPVAVISSPAEGGRFLQGRTVSFDGSASYDPDGGELLFRWETEPFSDPIASGVATFDFKLPMGDYMIELHVFDDLGVCATATVNISVVSNVPPSLDSPYVSPATGPSDLEGGFEFGVVYTDADNDPPERIQVKVGPPGAQVAHDLEPVDPGDTDHTDGRGYWVHVEVGTGPNQYVFACSDHFFSCSTALMDGPVVHRVQRFPFPSQRASVTVNWTDEGSASLDQVPNPGPPPAGVVMLSRAVRARLTGGTWSEAWLELRYDAGQMVDPETVSLMWYDPARSIWVPTTSQSHLLSEYLVSGQLPEDDTVLAVFGEFSPSYVNDPPHLDFTYDASEAYVGNPVTFDASVSYDPDGTVLLFHWDLTDDGRDGPWEPGVVVTHTFDREGTYQITLRAIDGQNVHYLHRNVTVPEEPDDAPGPWDNPGMLYGLGAAMFIAFGMAIAYRLHRPRTYDDLFGKAYREREQDEYSRLFRKLTEEEMRGSWEGDGADEELDEGMLDDGEVDEEGVGTDEEGDADRGDGTR